MPRRLRSATRLALIVGALAFLAGFFLSRTAGGVELETQILVGLGYSALGSAIGFLVGLFFGAD
jgi:hypothetical protein